MDNMTLYHADIHLPQEAKGLEFASLLKYTHHARQAAQEDNYGPIKLPTVFDSRNATLIEAGTVDGQVTKAVYRQHYDSRFDLCLVFNLKANRVITVWLNDKNDHHKSLDGGKYASN